MNKPHSSGTHAIVIGGGTTGLACAAAAARHFFRVTLLDRDRLPTEPVWRKGAPQGHHVHSLLKGGQQVLNEFFPGLTGDMLRAGAVEVDLGQDVIWYHSGGWKKRFVSGVRMQCQSRPFLEWHVRKRVAGLPNVEIRSLCMVEGLVHRGNRITGVQVGDDEPLEADLVIDAGGRNTLTPVWLERLGLSKPRTIELKVDIGYSSQVFEPAEGHSRDWKGMLIHASPPDTRTAALMPLEGGRWIVTLVGWNGDQPGGAMAPYMKWARGLAVPHLIQAIESAAPTDRVRRWNFPSNRRYHYESLSDAPEGLVVVGDANTSLNPIYAQGMSQGAIGARILEQSLASRARLPSARRLDGLPAEFHRRYGKFLDQCWMTSTAEDFGALDAGDGRAWYAPMLARYLKRFTALTWQDQDAALAFLNVMNLQQPATSLLRPGLMYRALFNIGRKARSNSISTTVHQQGKAS